MLYNHKHDTNGHIKRKLRRVVNELHGSCALLASESETLSYQISTSKHGQAWRDILSSARNEAANALNLCKVIENLLDKEAGLCRS